MKVEVSNAGVYVRLKQDEVVESREVRQGIIADLNRKGEVVGVEIIDEGLAEIVKLLNPDEVEGKLCCVCGHPLEIHIDEGEYWRCHHLDASGYQCECRLLKRFGDRERYDLKRRRKEQLESLLKDWLK